MLFSFLNCATTTELILIFDPSFLIHQNSWVEENIHIFHNLIRKMYSSFKKFKIIPLKT